MKGQFKGLVVGLLIGAFVLSGIIAVATDGLRTLENVKVGGIRLVIDNKEFTCTDANGAVVEPMIYNGTTYIPVRAVSTAFGKAVYWDGEESTVYLGDMDGKLENPTAKLIDLKNIASSKSGLEKVENVFDNYNNFYSDAVYADYSQNQCCEVLLDKKYSKFKATLFIPDGWNREDVDSVSIIGDDKIILPIGMDENVEMDKTSKPVEIEVDVTNVNNFKIVFNTYKGIRIANAGFYQ